MAKKYLMNNEGTIVRPHGRPNTNFSIVPDTILMDVSLGARARLILCYIVGRPAGWVATVTDIKKKLGLTEAQWKQGRDDLRTAGIIPPNQPQRMGGGVNKFTWVLDLMLERYYLSTDHQLKTNDDHPTKIADGSHQRFSMDGKTTDYQEEFTNIKKPPTRKEKVDKVDLAAVVDVVSEERKVRLDGLTETELRRFNTALDGASSEQILLCQKIWERNRDSARSPAGFAIGLAKRAARGELEGESAALVERVDEHLRAANVCGRHSANIGKLVGPDGPVGHSEDGYDGLLRSPQGGFFTQDQSSRLWLKLEAGELDFQSAK